MAHVERLVHLRLEHDRLQARRLIVKHQLVVRVLGETWMKLLIEVGLIRVLGVQLRALVYMRLEIASLHLLLQRLRLKGHLSRRMLSRGRLEGLRLVRLER